MKKIQSGEALINRTEEHSKPRSIEISCLISSLIEQMASSQDIAMVDELLKTMSVGKIKEKLVQVQSLLIRNAVLEEDNSGLGLRPNEENNRKIVVNVVEINNNLNEVIRLYNEMPPPV